MIIHKPTILALALGIAFVALLAVVQDERAETVISDLGQLAAVTTAALLCALTARSDRLHGRAWRWLAVGVGSWAAGQLVWTYYEVVAGTEVPFPSLADVGFLGFPVAAGIGLVSWLNARGTRAAGGRDLLDGAIVALSLLTLSWVTSLGSAVADSTGELLGTALSIAYPIGDVVLGSMVIIAVARGRRDERSVLVVLALGLGALALADSAYVYLVSIGSYASADLVSGGWVFGFLLIGAAAFTRRVDAARPAPPATETGVAGGAPSLGADLLPYLALLAAVLALTYDVANTPSVLPVDRLLGLGLVLLVLGRQSLALVENRRLFTELARTRDLLEHQALHDHLTGLPNRALFTDRLDRILCRPGAGLGLLFCDLDDFKQVNDTWGHDAGDQLLAQVGERLLGCVRTGDTVARLGGDEFALLLEAPDQAEDIAARVIEQMAVPFVVNGQELVVSMSVGVTQHRVAYPPARPHGKRVTEGPLTNGAAADPAFDDRDSVAHWLLRTADQAMYDAKTSGKARVVLGDLPMRGAAPERRPGPAADGSQLVPPVEWA